MNNIVKHLFFGFALVFANFNATAQPDLLNYTVKLAEVKGNLDQLEQFATTINNLKVAYAQDPKLDFSAYSDGNSNLKKRIKEIRDSVDSIDIPTNTEFTLGEMPELSALLSSDIETRHSRLWDVLSSLENGRKNIRELEQLKSRLEGHLSVTNQVSNLLGDLADAFLKSTQVPIPQLQSLFGLQWFDVETVLKPEVAKASRAYKAKIKSVNSAIADHRLGYSNFLGNMVTFLALDKSTIKKELDSLETDGKDIQAQIDEYQNESEELEKEKEKILKAEQALKKEAQSLEGQQSVFQSNVKSYNSSVSSLKKLEKKIDKDKYGFCPNNAAFSKCTHNTEKKRWVDRRNSWVNKYNSKAKSIEKKSKNLSKSKRSLESKVAKFNSKYQDLQRDVESFQKTSVARETKGEELREKFLEAIKLSMALSKNEELHSVANSLAL